MDLLQNKCYFIMKKSENDHFQPIKECFYNIYKDKMAEMNANLEFNIAGESHKGCVREANEDNFCYVSLYPGYLLAAVADGVGGHTGGDIASYLCCHRLILDWKELFREQSNPPDAFLARFLAESIQRANWDICSANYEKKNRLPMCTTVAAAVFTPDMVIAAHVGDSRIYCCRNGVCRQITVDHTVQNELMEQGVTNPSLVPGAHVISQALGASGRVKPEIHTYFRNPSDRYLLCTDGLTYCWSEQEIGRNLMQSPTPRAANDKFICNTLFRGAGDNITVISIF